MTEPALPTVIVLASGRGERFMASGGQGSKLRALLADRPVIEHTLAAVRASGLRWHVEDAGHPGMGDSIAAAVRATADAAGWLILPADLPLVQPATLNAVATALMQGPAQAVVPTHQGQRGHPVGFGPACRDELLNLNGNPGAVGVLQRLAAMDLVAILPVEDDGILIDIDTVEALQRAEARLRGRA